MNLLIIYFYVRKIIVHIYFYLFFNQSIHHVLMRNSHVPIFAASPRHNYAMVSMTAKIIKHLMRAQSIVLTIGPVLATTSNAIQLTSVLNLIGCVMGTMTVVTTLMKILRCVPKEPVLLIVSGMSVVSLYIYISLL